MKKIINSIGLLAALITLGSCGFQKPLTSNYFNNGKKVGIIYDIDSIGVFKNGSQGLLDMALTSENRFKEPLKVVDQKINPTQKIKNTFQNAFLNRKKQIIALDHSLDYEKLDKFGKSDSKYKEYHRYDLRSLKEQGIDELLIVSVRYGLSVSDYGMIETGKDGSCYITYEIVDLDDNSLLYRDTSVGLKKIKGKWKTPPNYDNLTNAIDGAISQATDVQKTKLYK
ncbi:hypothetical protein D2V08_03270 [Flagellimonas lutimaris]|uniref:Lipoprotein n=1 Tax=Flagellimonas lutimaris TaxID=475082 RepID=A0A3A1NA34_9FLAO|nr:hypothetical protein [Allomuricauda lutimaris]RIV35980.1 hypothetical protein D2V08_03270 [Allomuricauda lutimaris]